MDEGDGTFDLLTHVMASEHCRILRDWFEFLDVLPKRVVVIVGESPEIETALRSVCDPVGVGVTIAATCRPEDLKKREPEFVEPQFRVANPGLVMLVKLDTLPYRRPGLRWQAAAVAAMKKHDAVFATGSTLPWRADIATDDPRYALTRDVSNNFLLIDRDSWLRIQNIERETAAELGRFANERAIDDYCRKTWRFGLRLLNRPGFRVFHTQEWGPRMRFVRWCFRNGIALNAFLNGVEDDRVATPTHRYYMQPESMPIKAARIAFGRWRRDVVRRVRGR